MRPLWWLAPQEADFWAVDDAFLLGDALLVAPALAPAQEERFLRLPWGAWYDFWAPSEPRYGPAEVLLPTPLEHGALLVRAGALLPLDDGEALTLSLGWPPEGEYRSRFFFDAGDGEGPARVEAWTAHRSGSVLTLHRTVTGDFAFPYRRLRLVVHGAASLRVEADGHEVPPDAEGAFLLPTDVQTVTLLFSP